MSETVSRCFGQIVVCASDQTQMHQTAFPLNFSYHTFKVQPSFFFNEPDELHLTLISPHMTLVCLPSTGCVGLCFQPLGRFVLLPNLEFFKFVKLFVPCLTQADNKFQVWSGIKGF